MEKNEKHKGFYLKMVYVQYYLTATCCSFAPKQARSLQILSGPLLYEH